MRIFVYNCNTYIGKALVKELRKDERGYNRIFGCQTAAGGAPPTVKRLSTRDDPKKAKKMEEAIRSCNIVVLDLFNCTLKDVRGDMCSQWLLGVALLVAAWVLSIIVAPSLKPFAETVLDQVDNASWSLATMQIVLCTTCLLACCGRATCLSRQECQCDGCEGKDSGNASREELKPTKSEKADQSESDVELQKDDEEASTSLLCMGLIAGFEAVLLSAERPLAAWAIGNSYKSFFTVRVLLGLLPWSYMAPTILSYTPSSPYELMIPVAAVAFLIGGLLVLAQRKKL